MGQRQSYLSRVSTVLGLVLDLLGLVMGAMITLAVRTVAPSAKSAPMCWRSRLYRGAAHRLQRCRCATYWQAREKTLAPVSPCPARATFHHCQGCRRGRWQTERCCCKAEPSAAFSAHGCNDKDALETFSAIDCSTAEEKLRVASATPCHRRHRPAGHPCIRGHVHGQCLDAYRCPIERARARSH